jgi:hypothetical protein
MLALPPVAMSATRRKARADLVRLFEQDLERELDDVTKSWWSDEAQRALHAVAERLAKKK